MSGTDFLVSCGLWLAMGASAFSAGQDRPSQAFATSPDGRLRLEISVVREQGGDAPRYAVAFGGRPVVLPSQLGVELVDGVGLGRDSGSRASRRGSIRRDVHPASGQAQPGRRPIARRRSSHSASGLPGAALGGRPPGLRRRRRLPVSLPRPGGLGRASAIAGERTRFRLPDDAMAYALPLEGFTTSHEARYQKQPVAELPRRLAPRPAAAGRAAGDRLARGDRGQPDRLRGDVPGRATPRAGGRPGGPALPSARTSRTSPSGPTCRTSRPGGSS